MKAWGITDPGVTRKQNQDAFRVLETDGGQLLCVVCDGMGGARAGNVASKLAIDVFAQAANQSARPDMDTGELADIVKQAAELANKVVYEHSQLGKEYYGMGTTLVSSLFTDCEAVIANIGDSRAYLINSDGIFKITKDHSLVEDLIDKGEITPEQARFHPSRNLITRALGTEDTVKCDMYILKIQPGDNLLLCSDGLSNMLSDQELLFEVLHIDNIDDCCSRLLEIANSRGAPDNITVILVKI